MRWARRLSLTILFPILLYAVVWGTLALWFKAPGPDPLRILLAAAFAGVGAATVLGFFYASRWRWLGRFGAIFGVVLVWWNTLTPPAEGNWSPEVARQVTGVIDGDQLSLTNMRAFEWRHADDVTETWIDRDFDLSKLETLDLFMSYWGGPNMAHLIASFGFADGEKLAWSIEVRRSVGETFSPVADYFKANSMSVVASTEQDVVGLRSNIQGSKVYLYQLRADPAQIRALLEGYVELANQLDDTPQFFHSVFTNCSKTAIDLARDAGAPLPGDWRVIVNGYFPDYLYELGAMNPDFGFETIQELGYVSERANAFGLRPGFSDAIRVGVPER